MCRRTKILVYRVTLFIVRTSRRAIIIMVSKAAPLSGLPAIGRKDCEGSLLFMCRLGGLCSCLLYYLIRAHSLIELGDKKFELHMSKRQCKNSHLFSGINSEKLQSVS